MQADGRGARGHRDRGAHLGAGRHRVLPGAGRVLFDDVGERLGVSLRADQLLHLVVERRDLGVAERPVGQVGARHRAERGKLLEVDVPEPRHLGVPVHGPAADDLRQFVDAAGVLDGRAWFGRQVRGNTSGRVRGSSAPPWPGCRSRTRYRSAPRRRGWRSGWVPFRRPRPAIRPRELHRGEGPADPAADHHRFAPWPYTAPRSLSTSATTPVSSTGSCPSERSTSSLV